MKARNSGTLLGAPIAVAGAMLLSALAVPGCGVSSANSTSPQFSGRVTYNGQPLKHQLIYFAPKDVKNARDADWGLGATDGEGRFSISACMQSERMSPGVYAIFFGKKFASRASEGAGRDEQAEANPKSELPDRFYHADQSSLWVRLEQEARWIKIELRGDPKA